MCPNRPEAESFLRLAKELTPVEEERHENLTVDSIVNTSVVWDKVYGLEPHWKIVCAVGSQSEARDISTHISVHSFRHVDRALPAQADPHPCSSRGCPQLLV